MTPLPDFCNEKKRVLVILIAVVLLGCGKEQPVVEKEVIPTVDVLEVEHQTLYPVLDFTGSVISQEIARIHPEVMGTVKKVHVRVGDRVEKGDALVDLDPAEYGYKFQIARAENLKASAEYQKVLRGYRPEDIVATRNIYENARAIFRSKQKNHERNQVLFDSGTMTERDWIVFLEDLAAASAMVGKVSAELTKMELGYETFDIQSASAALMLAVANQALAKRNLTHCQIVSPISGVVSMRDLEVGQLVSTTQIVLEIQDPDQVWLLADASAKDAGLIRVGQEVDLFSDTLQESQKGQVDRISETLHPNTKSLSVWFAWDRKDALPPIGSFAKGTLYLDPVPNVLSLERQWIHLEKGVHFAWAVHDGVLVRKNLKLGDDRGEEVVIDAGLEKGTKLVVSAPTSFEEGLAVQIGSVAKRENSRPSDRQVISLSMSDPENRSE